MYINAHSLQAALPEKYKDIDIHIFDVLDSTNNQAKELAVSGAPHGTVVISRHQTAGKGRLGRSFFSPNGGIYMSVIIRPDFDISKLGLVTTAAAVAVAEAIDEVVLSHAPSSTAGCVSGSKPAREALIKWVNDVYIDDKKVCGILAEGVSTGGAGEQSISSASGTIDAIILGIGINTSTDGFPEELSGIAGAVTGSYSRSDLAAAVITGLLGYISGISICGSKKFLTAYKNKSLVLGKTISVYKGAYRTSPQELASKPARALDIDENGGLVVMYSDGSRETLISGEVTIRL